MILFRRQRPGLDWEISPQSDYASLRHEGYEYRHFNSEDEAAANHVPTPTITLSEYTKFVVDYDRADNKHYRFGQAFVNECLPSYIMDPDLFNTRNRGLAEKWIMDRYVSI